MYEERWGPGAVLGFDLDGVCAADATKPVPTFKGHFDRKEYTVNINASYTNQININQINTVNVLPLVTH